MKRFILLIFAVFIIWASALGDVVHMTDGRKITGRIIREFPDKIVIKTRYGEMTLDKMDIDHIEKGKLPEEIYKEKVKSIKPDDADGHFELGQWCKNNGLSANAKKEFEKSIAANPDHEGARKALGYIKKEGEWILTSPTKKDKSKAPSKTSPESNRKIQNRSSAQLSKLLKIIQRTIQNSEFADSDIEDLRSFDGLSENDFKKVAAIINLWKTYKPQNQEDFNIQAGGMQTAVHLPPKYDPKISYPLIISLHGAGGTGEVLRDSWLLRQTEWGPKIRQKYIVVGPNFSPDQSARWWQWPQSKQIYSLFNDIKNLYNIDTNRVIISGFSNGGHSAWSVGMKQPSLFTAIVPSAGLPVSENMGSLDLAMIANLMHVPLYLLHSADDRICPSKAAKEITAQYEKLGYINFKHKEYPSGGHVPHLEFWGTIFDWFSKFERDMYPKKFVFQTDHEEIGTAYWICLSGFSARAKVVAEIKNNTVMLKIEKAKKATIFLSDKLLDLDKPVMIEINGKQVFSEIVKRSAMTAVQEALNRKDRNAIYAASVELDVP